MLILLHLPEQNGNMRKRSNPNPSEMDSLFMNKGRYDLGICTTHQLLWTIVSRVEFGKDSRKNKFENLVKAFSYPAQNKNELRQYKVNREINRKKGEKYFSPRIFTYWKISPHNTFLIKCLFQNSFWNKPSFFLVTHTTGHLKS